MPPDFQAYCQQMKERNPFCDLEGGCVSEMATIIEACETEEQARACLTSPEIEYLMDRERAPHLEEAD